MKPEELIRRSRSPLVPYLLLALSALAAAPVEAGLARWTPVGPGRPHWREETSLGAVVPDASQPGSLWAGMAQGGLYRSDDHGVSWRWAGRPFAGAGVHAAAADPSVPGGLWVATRAGVFHSADAGTHWARLSGPDYAALLGDDEPRSLSVVPGRPATFYLRSDRRILASDDDGRSWRVALEPADRIRDDALAPGARPAFYVATVSGGESGLFSTTDGGRTWTALASCPALADGIEKIAVSEEALYVLPVAQESLGLLRSRDGGATWQPVSPDAPAGESVRLADVAVDPASPRRVWAIGRTYAGGSIELGLWASRDGGDVWQLHGQPLLEGDLTIGPDAVYAANPLSLASSIDDGWTWRLVLSAPYYVMPPSRISFAPGDPSHLMLVVGQTAYESMEGGQVWSLMGSPPVNDVWIDPGRPGHMYAAGFTWSGVTEDGGRSWKGDQNLFGFELLESAGGRTLFAGACGVYRSRNGGESWREVLPCLSNPRPAGGCEGSGNAGESSCGSEPGRYVQKLEVDPAHPQVVYALTFWVGDYYPGHDPWWGYASELWRSRDGGSTWRRIATDVSAFALDRNRSRLYASRGRDLLYSDDGGNVWRRRSQVPLSASDSLVSDLAVPRGMPFTIYAAATPALLRSRDGGRTWERFDRGLRPGDSTYLLTVHPADGRTVFARSASGVFHMRLP